MSDLPEYVLDREFNAPRDMVWKAWTDPELLARWYGPGVETVIHKFDLKPGGVWLNEMKWGENSMLSKMVFKEVTPTNQLVWDHYSATDKEWNSVKNPKMPDWPDVLLTTVTFEAAGAKTNVRLTQVPVGASEAENACFAQMMEGMSKGWGSGYTIMDEIFAELQSK